MKYVVVSPYITPLICETREEAESALYLLQCVGGFGQLMEVQDMAPDAPELVKAFADYEKANIVAIVPLEANATTPPKPRGRPRSK